MKTLKKLLFVIVLTLLTTSCTDTTENLVVKPTNTIENTIDIDIMSNVDFTGEGNQADGDDEK